MFASDDSLSRSRASRPLALLCGAALFAGCASRPVIELPELNNWKLRTEVLGGLTDWEFSGRIAVSAGEQGFNGRLRWTQDHDIFRATVSGPLGIGTVRIEGDGQGVVLTDKDGVQTNLENVEDELLIRYGWTIPVRSLRYWALGIPDPAGKAQTELNAEHQLEKLQQRDWHLSISRYRVSGGQSMPYRLSVKNSATRVRIVIDKWRFFD